MERDITVNVFGLASFAHVITYAMPRTASMIDLVVGISQKM